MSVVSLVTLLANAARVMDHEAWEVAGVEAPVLVAVGVQVMGMGAGAIVQEDLLGAAAYHLVVVGVTAGRLHIVILVVIHLMQMEIKVGTEAKSEMTAPMANKYSTTIVLFIIGLIVVSVIHF